METCENCGCSIGKIETPCVVDDHIVCSACHDKIKTSRTPAQRPAEAVVMQQPQQASPPPPQHQPMPTQPQTVTNVIVNQGDGGYTVGGVGPAICSFLIPGLGQLVKGQPINAAAWFFITILGYIALILPGVILHICCIVGAASTTRRR